MPVFATPSKISPPNQANIIDRHRLIDILDRERDKRLTLILGQAAQGKSTLAASWVKRLNSPWAWLNLDSDESDPVNLFHLLVQSMQHACENVDLSHLHDYPGLRMGLRLEIPMYRDWTKALLETAPISITIVLDGLDQLLPDADAFNFIRVLISDAPDHVHFVALSRSMPPLDVPQLRMTRQAALIDNQALAFSAEETRNFFEKICNISLPKSLRLKVHQLTEGWVGSLILLAESLRRKTPQEAEHYLSEGFASHLKAEVFQYLGEEVFRAQPMAVQTFLTRSSILKVIEPGFVKGLLDIETPEVVLDTLARRNLFIQPVYDEQRGWQYRFHKLFKEFLKAKFEADTTPEERREWFFKAGSCFEKIGDHEEAIRCYLGAGAHPDAARLLETTGLGLLKAGRIGDLARWLEALPKTVRRNRPWLLFHHYMTKRLTAPQDYINDLLKALELFEQSSDARGCMLSLAYIIEMAAGLQISSIPPIQNLLDKGEMFLESQPVSRFAYERAILLLNMAFARYLRLGNSMKAYQHCSEAHLLAKGLGDIPLQLHALIHMHSALTFGGELSRAEKTIKKVDRLINQLLFPELVTYHLLHTGFYYCHAGDFVPAQKILLAVEDEIEKHGLIFLYPAKMLLEIQVHMYTGRHQTAEEIGLRLIDYTKSLGYSFGHGIALFFFGLNFYQSNDYEQAGAFLLKAREIFASEAAQADGCLCAVKILLGLIDKKNPPQCTEDELREACDYFFKMKNVYLLKEAHLAMALRKFSHKDPVQAAHHLEAGFKIAHEKGYRHWYLLNRKDLLKACLSALELEIPKVGDYVTTLLTGPLSPIAMPELLQLCQHSSQRIAHRAFAIAETIHRAGRPRIRIHTLGEFRVYRGEEAIDSRQWGGSQPKRLLAALISRGAKQVPMEKLIEDLWPENPPDSGRRKFTVNLHRLRKALEPDSDNRFGSSYIHLKDNLLTLDPELSRLDVDRFHERIKEGDRMAAQGKEKDALTAYGEADVLYQGDFLPEETDSPWAANSREALRRYHFDLLNRMADMYEKLGKNKKAIACHQKIIRLDPTWEGSYRCIMRLYAARGLQTEALRTYEECRRSLKEGLGVEPDALTTALYKKLNTSVH